MEEKKLSYSESWKLNLRALGIWKKICPNLFISMIVSAAVSAVVPYVAIFFSAKIIGELAGRRNPEELIKWVIITLIVTGICQLINSAASRWYHYESEKIDYLNTHIYMDKMTALDYSDIDNQQVYDLFTQIEQTEQWRGYGLMSSCGIFYHSVNCIIGIISGIGLTVTLFTLKVPENHSMVFFNNPLMALAMGGLMFIIAIAASICKNKAELYWTNSAEDSRLGNRLFSFFGFANVEYKRAVDMRLYNQQDNICTPYMAKDVTFTTKGNIAKKAKGPMGIWSMLSSSVSVVLTAVIYLFVCLKSWAGAFGVGLITQYIGAVTQIFTNFSKLIIHIGEMRINADFLKTCFKFLDMENKMYKGSLTTEKRSDRNYEVEFKDVSFKYPNTQQWVLRHVNMKFKIGSRLAVVGENGSGKTTFIKLLCRLYDPTEGEILLNGIDIRKYKYNDYIDIFSVVFQDFKLFAQTLGQNVACSINYDRNKAEKCLIDAGFENRLKTLPNGLDTYLYKILDENGVDVSGGEAQKIAIARALYKDSAFMVLDEPTAALDPIAEAEIYSRFNDIVTDKTTIYISHRLSSCKFCDEIVVFDNGSVVQSGQHESLLSDEKGKYNQLWYAQAQYYNENEN